MNNNLERKEEIFFEIFSKVILMKEWKKKSYKGRMFKN